MKVNYSNLLLIKKKQFSEHQIIKILKERQQGKTVDEICRSNNVSSATFYRWKSKYSGMEASDIKRMKELEAENNKLKKETFALKEDIFSIYMIDIQLIVVYLLCEKTALQIFKSPTNEFRRHLC